MFAAAHNHNDCASCWAEGDVATTELTVDICGDDEFDGDETDITTFVRRCVGWKDKPWRTCYGDTDGCDGHAAAWDTGTPLADSIMADWYAGKLKNDG